MYIICLNSNKKQYERSISSRRASRALGGTPESTLLPWLIPQCCEIQLLPKWSLRGIRESLMKLHHPSPSPYAEAVNVCDWRQESRNSARFGFTGRRWNRTGYRTSQDVYDRRGGSVRTTVHVSGLSLLCYVAFVRESVFSPFTVQPSDCEVDAQTVEFIVSACPLRYFQWEGRD